MTVSDTSSARFIANSAFVMQDQLGKIASGSRIVKASDDAAGLAISTVLKADTAVLNQGARNAANGASLAQIADGGLARISDNLTRMKELAGQALSGAVTDSERSAINKEFTQLREEVGEIARTTRFNGESLLDNTDSRSFAVGSEVGDSIALDNVDATEGALGIDSLSVDSLANAQNALSGLDAAINQVSDYRAEFGATQSRFEQAGQNLATQIENTQAATSALADQDLAQAVTEMINAKSQNQASIYAHDLANQQRQFMLRVLE